MEVITLSLNLVVLLAAATLTDGGQLISPLFGCNPGAGKPFNDVEEAAAKSQIERVNSLVICYDTFSIHGIQASYTLENGENYDGPLRGNCVAKPGDANVTRKVIVFKKDETIVRVNISSYVDSNIYAGITELTLITSTPNGSLATYGLFGSGFGRGWSMPGKVVGFFGRSGDLLYSVGVYINDSALPTSLYHKTDLFGVKSTDAKLFDDVMLAHGPPLKITNVVATYQTPPFTNLPLVFFGFRMTYYVSPPGTESTVQHGYIDPYRGTGVLNLADDEWIVQMKFSFSEMGEANGINSLMIVTQDSKGSVKTFGPYGHLDSDSNVVTVDGVVHALYGLTNNQVINNPQVCALGFYI